MFRKSPRGGVEGVGGRKFKRRSVNFVFSDESPKGPTSARMSRLRKPHPSKRAS